MVVIPTYNEKENIERLIKRIFELGIPSLKMVVVDDNSPDGTGEILESLKNSYPIHVIHQKEKMGLGRAYVRAFHEILKEPPDYIIQMDADFSHDPAAIPRFLETINNYDLVLGSRYTSGGKIENWDFLRRLVSRFGNIYARMILNLPYTDLTGGFKCWRREVLEQLDLESLSSLGYNFQIETTYKTHQKNFRIHEIPIVFTERKSGTSKFNLSIILESFLKVPRMRFRR